MDKINAQSNPFAVFADWFEQAQNCGLQEPTAMTVATSTPDGKPSARVVLLKTFDERGFVFYTNSRSRKGEEVIANPNVALCFHWQPLAKQIRIEGKAVAVKGREADEYFSSRHPESRLGAWASQQSKVLPNREAFLGKVEEMREKFGENPPRPMHWYGFRIVPNHIEFWDDGEFRLHDRDVFERENENSDWKYFKLYP